MQYAVILLGFGLNFFVIFKTGKESLPIILSTITTSLAVAFFLQKLLHMTTSTAILIGVGSSGTKAGVNPLDTRKLFTLSK